MSSEVRYPFVPKSNRFLIAGQYWAIPLSNGQFACGRVMDVPAFGEGDRVGVVVGLMDWVGREPPEHDRLAGHHVLEQAASRFDTVTLTGGHVLGIRPLASDGLVPNPFDDFGGHRVWGALTIQNLAEQYFTP